MSSFLIHITPQPAVRANQGDSILFRIPTECPYTLKQGNVITVAAKGKRSQFKAVIVKIGEKVTVRPKAGGKSYCVARSSIIACDGLDCKHKLSYDGKRRLDRLERYNNYKEELRAEARRLSFTLPNWGWSMYFYFPMPAKWNAAQRKAMHGQPHLRKPDIDNLEKGIYDALSITDEQVSQLSGHGKFWVDNPTGWIEIKINMPAYNPFGVEFMDPAQQRSLFAQDKKRKYTKKAIEI